ncbi:glutamate mutase L [Eubacteriales bacterium OttesenSCG-928-A19]|nr:glutamate mutase L [Eubacteriales bacterium OttesenSCG-928-A19]
MKPVLLIDFGSTYTKVTAVDVETPRILATGSAYTTVQTDIGEGLDVALAELLGTTGPLDFAERYACSSAAGGLRMIACGLVPSLTVEAAKRAALGAGAKVIRVYSYELTDEDIAEIGALSPDILLLTGGTDGGNRANILQNAGMLSGAAGDFPIVIAGNRAAVKDCAAMLGGSGHEAIVCENVMPVFNKLNIEPVQAVIRELFLRRIVQAKGLSQQQALLDGILMPTPAAVMRALRLLSVGVPGQPGLGDLAAVDLGGATTDVYSIADGLPSGASTVLRGLPEPHAKRTVEGDIGMRYSAAGILEAAGMEKLVELSGLSSIIIETLLERIAQNPDILPAGGDDLARLDEALASAAIELALTRHAGTLEQVFTPAGMVYQQTGKDLTRVSVMLLTGGALVHGGHADEIARYAMQSLDEPASLKPRDARPVLDRNYILAAMGLLSQSYPDAAFSLMRQEFDKGV